MSNTAPTALEAFFQLLVQSNGSGPVPLPAGGSAYPRHPILNVIGGSVSEDIPNNRINLTVGTGLPTGGADGDQLTLVTGAPAWVPPSAGLTNSTLVSYVPPGTLVTATTGGTIGVLSEVASLTIAGSSILVTCSWAVQVVPPIVQVAPFLEYSTTGGSTWTQFATSRCPGIPLDGVFTASGLLTIISFNRILDSSVFHDVVPGATVQVRLSVDVYGASGHLTDGFGDHQYSQQLAILDLR